MGRPCRRSTSDGPAGKRVAGRRGARTGRGWDAAPPRKAVARQSASPGSAEKPEQRPAEKHERTVDDGERAREICLRLLAVRPRTRAELATALRRQGISDDVATSVLDRYDEVGIVDDTAFARAWVTSRHHGKGLAKRALAGELRRRGVDDDHAAEALDELDGETERATARELVDRRLRAMSSGPPDVMLRRLVGMLARKGYPPGLAFRVVREALEADERTSELAAGFDIDQLAEAAETAENAAAVENPT